ncbi:MAG: STAS domain-containing protein [Planctomycetota bacterium]
MLKLNIQTRGDITVVSLEGIIDAFACNHFEEGFNRLMEGENYKLIVDLSKVDYMTSIGAGIFIAVHGMAHENKGAIILVNPKPKVREIFDVLGVSKILSFTDTIDNAFKVMEQLQATV